MKRSKKNKLPKQIVYLLGAGSTQAEASHMGGSPINLLMKDFNTIGVGMGTRIVKRANLGRELESKEQVDIEKLISLLSETGRDYGRKKAEELRRAYYEELLYSLSTAGIINNPELAIGLLELHNDKIFMGVESLSGIISLNHDNLFQIASQKVFKGVNLGFVFESSNFKNGTGKEPLLLQLHGSFNWINETPIRVIKIEPRLKYDSDILWIPPTILKESKNYPYNKLMGLAYEILAKKCDVLRVIGCSLSQNDWNIISLLFNAQQNQYRQQRKCFTIELIMSPDSGKSIEKECSYLRNFIPIEHLKDGSFNAYKEMPPRTPKPSEIDNQFKYWLKQKINYHKNRKELFEKEDISPALKKIIGKNK